MKRIYINGPVVPDKDAFYYSWWREPYSSPGSLKRQLDEAAGDSVELWINSVGGDVWSAMEMYSELQAYQGETSCFISGLAASAATIVMCGCQTVKASIGAQCMIHNVMTSADGDYRDMQHTAETLQIANDGLKAIYAKKTGKSYDELQEMLDAETWFSANTAKEAGFVDEITDFSDVRLVASVKTTDLKARYDEAMKITHARLAVEKERY